MNHPINSSGDLPINNSNSHMSPDHFDDRNSRYSQIWYHLSNCSKKLEREIGEQFRRQFSSSLVRFEVLKNLHDVGNRGIASTQLGDRIMASGGNITRLLDRMEADDLIIRKPASSDRRVNVVYIVARGELLFRKMMRAHAGWISQFFATLSDAEADSLIRILDTIRCDES